MTHLNLDGIPVTIIRKPIKNMYLRIKPTTGEVLVSAPQRLSLKTIQTQLTTKQAWYRQQMQLLLPDLIQKWEPIIGVHAHAWSIKPMKTRWGSCNTTTHRISLNLHLMHKPLICLEYVLVHELVHLLEASHNSRFYALMTQFMPDWKIHKKQLEHSCHL